MTSSPANDMHPPDYQRVRRCSMRKYSRLVLVSAERPGTLYLKDEKRAR